MRTLSVTAAVYLLFCLPAVAQVPVTGPTVIDEPGLYVVANDITVEVGWPSLRRPACL